MSAGASDYRLLAEVAIEHDYFADGRGRHMLFGPCPRTAVFLQRFRVLVRSDGASLSLFAEAVKLPLIWSERKSAAAEGVLHFDVHSADPACACYTAPVASTGSTAPAAPGGPGAQPVPLLEPPAGRIGVLTTLAVPLDPSGGAELANWTAALGARYRLRLQSRSTTWKYLLIGAASGRRLSILDQRGEVSFSEPATESLPGGREALAVRSQSPIALRERPAERFELRDVTRSPERVLIPRLPGARPQRLWREPDAGSSFVSEIFINC